MEIRATENYVKWFAALRDERAKDRIEARILLMAKGHLGDSRRLQGRVSEIRINYGPGYRLYYTFRGQKLVILLAGGDKSTQKEDIIKAVSLAENLPEKI